MAHLDRTPLGESVLARRWYCDVNSGTYGAPTWVAINGVMEFTPTLEPSVQDDSDFDSAGYKSSTITALGWTLGMKLARKVTAASAVVYDPGQEVLRLASKGMSTSNSVDVRWYEVTDSGPITEAYRGYAAVSWTEDGGAMDALASVSVTLTGQGARADYTHPDFAAAAPVLYSITPAAGVQAGGTLHKIVGKNFFAAGVSDVSGADHVLFGVTSATTYYVESDQVIWALAPAKAAAQFIIYVENSTGKSATTSVVIDIT